MILAIRIAGLVEISSKVEDILQRLRLRRKYSAVILSSTKKNLNLLRKVRSFIAYGEIDKTDLLSLIQTRGISKDKKKIDAQKTADIIESKGILSSGIKSFFRLHPPRGGIDSKLHYPIKKGVLGYHGDKINLLLRRML